ncbi:MAG TPA: prolipoprotein diacylglyceryl transferase family protein [Labilithrix sp.]|nr:prolipoprotein diacylglyceryl transferase family protein [Labilithrix sp.]
MIPYIQVHDFHLGPITLHPFGVLVGAGVILGVMLATRRAKKLGLDTEVLQSFTWWMLIGGFVGGHVFDALLYHPAEVIARPWALFMIWEGLSSFGGFAGSLIGVLLWRRYEKTPARPGDPLAFARFRRRATTPAILPYCDAVMSIFPIAWAFGRAGCAVVHDHPGARAPMDSWLAVAYGPGTAEGYGFFELQHGNAPRYDLGLLEMLFAVVLSVAFALTWSRRVAVGSYLVAGCLSYAPVRFTLDFLRAEAADGGDPRYGRLTPAQWACVGLFVFGLLLWRHIRAQAEPLATPAERAVSGSPGP